MKRSAADMLSANTDCSYEKDDRHLQGLAAQFVSSVDLLLCAWDGKAMFGFPVHRVIILAHSPVLSELLEDLSGAEQNASRQKTMPRIPMTGDSCTAIRAALDCIYGSYPSASKGSSMSALLGLQDAAACARNMVFPHKYGMTLVLTFQEEKVIPVLRRALDRWIFDQRPDDDSFAHIVECASMAEHCGCVAVHLSLF